MTSQVSSPAEQTDAALVGEQRASGNGGEGKEVRRLDRVIIRFAGDSGDGMQLTGDRFTSETASFGNDLSTLPNFPAEIRAPAGTLPGVSSFQLHFADHDILTPGDAPNVLVAMNPAALKANLADVPRGADIIVNTDEFTKRPMAKVGYATSPLEDGSLEAYNVHPVPLTTLTIEALKDFGLSRKEAERSKNMFALGLLSWMYHRPTEGTEKFLRAKFAKKPDIAEANVTAFRAGWNFGETTEDFAVSYEVAPATKDFPTGTYRNISGNLALSYGLVAAGRQADLPLYLGSYPITPASDILHELSKHKNFGVRTFQAEDEIAGIGAALGAAFGGALAVTTTSGPGVALKSETIGLAVSLELPLLIVDIQRGGPSTGLPTKTEQADLLQAMYGRNGEAPVPIVAPKTPADCFDAALDAARIALTYRTPVFLLSDGYLANGSEPWRIPDIEELPICGSSSPPAPTTSWRTAPRCSGRTSVTSRRWPAPGPCRARRVLSTASAASRSRTAPATSPTTPPTTTSWCAPARRRWTASRFPTSRSTTPPTRAARAPGPLPWAGVRRTDRSPRRSGASGVRETASRRPICAISTPSRGISARSWRVTTR